MGFLGVLYTWNNKREGDENISERLDRFLANSRWCDVFPSLRVQHGVASYSDHVPLWMDTHGALVGRGGEKMFRFEATWFGDSKCANIVEKNWNRVNDSSSIRELMGCISSCASDLKKWNQSSFRNVPELSSAKMILKRIQEDDPTCQKLPDHKQACEDVQKWLERDEVMWKQRSRVMWLREGDCNLKYFHSKATVRSRKYRILQLKDEAGNWKQERKADG